MKQILQHLKSGEMALAEIPCPSIGHGMVLIQTTHSLISAGTERMLIEFSKGNLLQKARSQPDKVRQVLDKIHTDGLTPTLEAVFSKLDQPLPLGYCNTGRVLAVGNGVHDLQPGDRVASNGPHAEVVSIPHNLAAKIPDAVEGGSAAFTVLGAIALHGIRLAQATLGEAFVVTGLGLIGLLAVQLLKAHGCRVLGIDYDQKKLDLARRLGAETVNLSSGADPVAASESFSRGYGMDGVIITASTKSSEPVHQAALMCRKRGRIVLVGMAGLELSRDDFYKKELSFQVSCSYGPGRYDPEYEEKGHDYPIGYVRWTEQRNFEAVLDMMSSGALNVEPLISHRFKIEDAEKAYALIAENKEPYIGILLEYGKDDLSAEELEYSQRKTVELAPASTSVPPQTGASVVGMIGAGNYSGRVLLPAIAKNGVRLKTIASGSGLSGTHYGKKYGFELSTTDTETLFADPEINTVFITTRHDSHARFVIQALKAGKHVFVEKPLCLTLDELAQVTDAKKVSRSENQQNRNTVAPSPLLMVGFNRRFAPQVQKIKELLQTVTEPKSFIITVNAGSIPADHWTQDPEAGGGRIIGEACHFVDLLRFLAGAPITDLHGIRLGKDPLGDKATLTLSFADGSMGTIHYLANGHKAFPKERIEVFCCGRVLELDNFRKLKGYGWPGFKKMNLWRQDKGQAACTAAFLQAVQNGGPCPIPFDEIMEVTRVTIELSRVINTGMSLHGENH